MTNGELKYYSKLLETKQETYDMLPKDIQMEQDIIEIAIKLDLNNLFEVPDEADYKKAVLYAFNIISRSMNLNEDYYYESNDALLDDQYKRLDFLEKAVSNKSIRNDVDVITQAIELGAEICEFTAQNAKTYDMEEEATECVEKGQDLIDSIYSLYASSCKSRKDFLKVQKSFNQNIEKLKNA